MKKKKVWKNLNNITSLIIYNIFICKYLQCSIVLGNVHYVGKKI